MVITLWNFVVRQVWLNFGGGVEVENAGKEQLTTLPGHDAQNISVVRKFNLVLNYRNFGVDLW